MKLDEYTPENICKAMGLPSFANDPELKNAGEAIRVVFKPSFHAEATITFRPSDAGATVQATVLLSMFWQEPFVHRRLPSIRASTHCPSPSYVDLANSLAEANRSLEPGNVNRGGAFCDGMALAVCHYALAGATVFIEHTYSTESVLSFTRLALAMAWNASTDPRIANVISDLSAYVDVEYPHRELPPNSDPPVTHMLVLGTPDDRKEYFDKLREHGKSANNGAPR